MTLLSAEFLRRIDRLRIHSRGVFRGSSRENDAAPTKEAASNSPTTAPTRSETILRNVDWNVYARLDRLFIKLFRAEEDLPISILLDSSASMDFGEPTKLTQAKRVAAALGYIGLTGLDRVSIHAFSDIARPIVPPAYGKSQFARLSKALEAVNARGKTDLARCLRYLTIHSRQTGVAIIISDFLD